MLPRRCLPLLFLLASAAPSLHAQAPPIPAHTIPPPVPTAPASLAPDAHRIVLDVVVSGKSETPLALQEKDFTILDNKEQRPIESFRAINGAATPDHLVLVVDAVNSPFQAVAYQRSQIDKFLRANGGHLSDPLTLAVFTDQGMQIQQKETTDGNALSAALDKYTIGLRTLRRSTGFYGATDRFRLSVSALQRLATLEGTHPGHTSILWLSPGWPILSGPGIQLDNKEQAQIFASIVNLSTLLRQSRVTLYSVDAIGAAENTLRTFYYQNFVKGVSRPSQTSIGNLSLQVLAVQSGGLALNSSNDLAAQLQKCVADHEEYYELSFDPGAPDKPEEYHHLEIKLDVPGLTARTRDGYYTQP